MVLAGDFRQLPPVADLPMFVDLTKFSSMEKTRNRGDLLYRMFEVISLKHATVPLQAEAFFPLADCGLPERGTTPIWARRGDLQG